MIESARQLHRKSFLRDETQSQEKQSASEWLIWRQRQKARLGGKRKNARENESAAELNLDGENKNADSSNT
jgi:hypothetical protein